MIRVLKKCERAATTGLRYGHLANVTGSSIRKKVPYPAVLVSPMVPPCPSMIPWHGDRPNPVPTPTGLVVKKGSKIRTVAGRVAILHRLGNVGDIWSLVMSEDHDALLVALLTRRRMISPRVA
jgi:hypothetical protein